MEQMLIMASACPLASSPTMPFQVPLPRSTAPHISCSTLTTFTEKLIEGSARDKGDRGGENGGPYCTEH